MDIAQRPSITSTEKQQLASVLGKLLQVFTSAKAAQTGGTLNGTNSLSSVNTDTLRAALARMGGSSGTGTQSLTLQQLISNLKLQSANNQLLTAAKSQGIGGAALGFLSSGKAPTLSDFSPLDANGKLKNSFTGTSQMGNANVFGTSSGVQRTTGNEGMDTYLNLGSSLSSIMGTLDQGVPGASQQAMNMINIGKQPQYIQAQVINGLTNSVTTPLNSLSLASNASLFDGGTQFQQTSFGL